MTHMPIIDLCLHPFLRAHTTFEYSQVIVFNLKDVQRTTALDTLAVLQCAANAVAPAESQGVYGRLVVLVRDTYEKSDDVHRLLFDMEEPDESFTNNDVDEMDMRNKTRQKLKKVFQDIKVWCLPQPHSDINGESKTI